MEFLRQFLRRLRGWFRRAKLDAEMAEEMRLHLELRAQANLAAGLSPDEADQAARRQFGGVDQLKEIAREQRGWRWLDRLNRDVRGSVRSFAKAPGFTAVAVVTLAVGIGLNTTMASLLDALLLRLAPFAGAAELVRIEGLAPDGTESGLSVPEIAAIEAGIGSVVTTLPFRWVDAALTDPPAPAENFVALSVTGNFFQGMGVPAALGRTFGAVDLTTRDAPVVVLGHEMWQRRFGGDPGIVNRTIRLNERAVTVLGVMPPAFNYRLLWGYGDLWVPGTFMEDRRNDYENRQYSLIARLRPGSDAMSVQTKLDTLATRFAADHPQTNTRRTFRVSRLHESTISPGIRRLSLLVTGISGVVLVIVCVNVASLQLSRALSRSRDFAVSAALGASRGQLLARQLTESLLLALAGGVAGCVIAAWGNQILSQHLVVGLAGKLDLQLNLPVLFGLLACSLLTGLACGFAPALLAARTDVSSALKQQSRGSTASRQQHRLRQGLIAVEIALSLVLLTGAGIMIRNVESFLRRPVGWDTSDVAFGTVALPRATYDSPDKVRTFHRQIEQQLALQPGITHSALSSLPPLISYWTTRHFVPEGQSPGGAGIDAPMVFYVLATPSYFETLRIPLLEGRLFPAGIAADDPPVAIINESLARALWPGRSAVGRRLSNAQGTVWSEIVGVVRDVDFPANTSRPLTPFQVYRPFVQDPWHYITMAVRGPGGFPHLASALRRAVAQLDAGVPVQDVTNVPQFVARQQRNLHVIVRVLTAFALIGLGLAGLGVYGVIAHGVVQRRSEFGIRLALGARPADLSRLVLGHGCRVACAGILLGIGGAVVFARILEAVLPRVVETTPDIFLAGAVVVMAIALLASWVPARRAAQTDPLVALRSE